MNKTYKIISIFDNFPIINIEVEISQDEEHETKMFWFRASSIDNLNIQCSEYLKSLEEFKDLEELKNDTRTI